MKNTVSRKDINKAAALEQKEKKYLNFMSILTSDGCIC